jgi:hypothetical protein
MFKRLFSKFYFGGESVSVLWAIWPSYNICKVVGLCCIDISNGKVTKMRRSWGLIFYSLVFFAAYIGELATKTFDSLKREILTVWKVKFLTNLTVSRTLRYFGSSLVPRQSWIAGKGELVALNHNLGSNLFPRHPLRLFCLHNDLVQNGWDDKVLREYQDDWSIFEDYWLGKWLCGVSQKIKETIHILHVRLLHHWDGKLRDHKWHW